MIRIVRYALLSALFCCTAHAQFAQIGSRCNLTPDMDYLAVSIWTRVDIESRTYVVGPDWFSSGGELALRILDHASLTEGKRWLRLPDDAPAYCEVTMRAEDLPSSIFVPETYLHEIQVFSLPKDRWTYERNQGVAGYLRELDQFYDPEFNTVTVRVSVDQAAHSWLADYYADLARELRELEALLDEPYGDDAADVTAGAEDRYLVVATSPPPGQRVDPGEPGYFGIAWHPESQYDAGRSAIAECQRQGGGGTCGHTANGTSLRGGCVGVAMARWRDQGKDPERAYVVTSSSFRNLIARDLRSGCRSTAFSGKYEETVIEHSCEIERIICAADLAPAAGTP